MAGITWGETAPRLLDPPTADDFNRTHELQQFLCESRLSEDLMDSTKRAMVVEELRVLVKTCVKNILSEKGQLTEAPDMLVLTYGSYHLGVHIPSDDLEIHCFSSPLVNCEDFFKALHSVLVKNGAVAKVESLHKEKSLYGSLRKKEQNHELEALQKEKAIEFKRSPGSFMRFKLQGISLVLTYSIISEVSFETLDIMNDSLLYHVDEANLPGFDRCRVSAITRYLVPKLENFQVALRYVNFWAGKRGLYSNVTGYLKGVHWAILVARICQIYPSAIPSVLVMKFFEIYAEWYWPSPVMLYKITRYSDLPYDVWDAPSKETDDYLHIMPIISPAYPAWNLSSCVSKSTLRLMKEEFVRGNDICKKIKLGQANWSELCVPLEFFKTYNLYLHLDIRAKNEDDLSLWKVEVEPLWRKFIIQIEAPGNQKMECHLCPTEYAYDDDAEHHSAIFIGIKRMQSTVNGWKVSVPLPIDSKIVNVLKDEITKRKKPGLDLVVSHFRQANMPDSVRKLVLDSGV